MISITNPDGVTIRPNEFPSIEAALNHFDHWLKRYEIQGYYSCASGYRIAIYSIAEYCDVFQHGERIGTVQELKELKECEGSNEN